MFDPSGRGFPAFEEKVWLSSPTMYPDSMDYVLEAYRTNWMSTVGANIDAVEEEVCRRVGCGHAVALSSGTAALHLAVKLAGERVYGAPAPGHGALEGRLVAASDMTFAATVNPILYEGGVPVFVDAEYGTWNMDPAALERAFARYPEIRVVVAAHLYGTPSRLEELLAVCRRHGALLVEDAAESLGASFRGVQTGRFGTYSAISFNGNKIITGSSGGMLLTDDGAAAAQARKWSTQAREDAPWYQHREAGYNYRMSNVIAGVVRGQLPHLEEHIAGKEAIYRRYQEGLRGLPVQMNPYDGTDSAPNFWLSCLLIDREAMCRQERGEREARFVPEHGKSCPTEILAALASIRAEGRPIWKPMHLQPLYRENPFVAREDGADVGADIFARGLCLPSDNKMTAAQQDRIIEVIRSCFA